MVPRDELEGYKRSRLTLVLAALAAIVVVALVLAPAGDQEVPEFELPLLSGGTLSSDELKGSPVVLNFWASWCEPCREEAPLLERMHRRYEDEGVRIIGVNIRDSTANARRFVREFDLSFPIVRDPDEELASGLEVYGLPQTFFVDRDWRLESTVEKRGAEDQANGTIVLGAITEEQLRTQIERMLADG
jgi:cytochrome c biogenesis protein CcmG, thiol:disulfide interchange protein DsbE